MLLVVMCLCRRWRAAVAVGVGDEWRTRWSGVGRCQALCLVGLSGGDVWGPLVGARVCCFLLCIIIIMRVSHGVWYSFVCFLLPCGVVC